MGALVSDALLISAIGKINQASARSKRKSRLTAAVIGNSIGHAAKYASVSLGFSSRASFLWANEFAGAPLRFRRMTASTRGDVFGIYGYSGQTLPTILGDLEVQLFTPLATAGVTPDVVIGLALIENDLLQGRTIAQMQASVTEYVRNVQAHYPGVIQIICTPHLNGNATGGANTQYNQADFLAITAWMLTLDNGIDILVTDISQAYADATYPERAETQTFTASFSGTTMTVTNAGNATIGNRMAMSGAGITTGTSVSSFGTGTGGTGTYTISNSHTLSAQSVTLHPWTDDNVHPNTRACLEIGRLMAATLSRIGTVWAHEARHYSTNPAMGGTASATATGITGTKPTGTNFTTPTNCTVVSTADQSGWRIRLEGLTTQSSSYLGVWASGASNTLSSPAYVEGLMEVEIVEGAENIRLLEHGPRVNDGSGNNFQYWKKNASTESEPAYRDGDILTLRAGAFPPASGAISSMINYLGIYPKLLQTGTGVIELIVRKEAVAVVT